MIFLVVALVLLTTLVELPAFSWLIQSILPALLLAIPVIFAPEIRRALERLGRAGTLPSSSPRLSHGHEEMQKVDPCRGGSVAHGFRHASMAR